MKRDLLNILQHSFRTLAVVVAAFCLSAAADEEKVQEKSEVPNRKPGESATPQESADVLLGQQTDAQRNKVFDTQVLPKMLEAGKLYSAGKYEAAYQAYMEAKDLAKPSVMGYGPYVLSMNEKIDLLKNKAQVAYANEVMREARAAYTAGLSARQKNVQEAIADYQKAKELAGTARTVYYVGFKDAKRQNSDQSAQEILKNPGFSQSVDAFLADCDKQLAALDYREKTSFANADPDYKDRQNKINVLLRNSETLYQNQEYMKVRDNIEMVLVLDPFNERAYRLLSKTYKKLYNVAMMRSYNEILAQNADNDWKWNEAVLPTEKIIPKDAPKEKTNSKAGLYEKLQDLIVDNIEFDRANIQNVISYIRTKSKEIDPEGLGVNVVLNIAPDDIKRIDDAGGVTITLDHVPLLEVLRYISQGTDLRFRVEDKFVIIGSAQNVDEMNRKFFSVRASLIQRITGNSPDSTGNKSDKGNGEFTVDNAFEGNKVEDMFKTGAGAAAALGTISKADSETLKKYFSARGIPFEAGTTIAYDARTNKLIVSNTPENLRKLESLLRDIDVQTPLVLMESKILEITVTDLEELGFDWLLTYQNQDNSDITWKMESPIKSSSYTNNTLINNMNILPNFGGDNLFNLYLTVNAIDRTDRSEVLSTPKVIATTGSEAEIRMVREMYFPESWTEPNVTSSNGSSFQLEPSYPEFGDATDVGIVFTATPNVSPNNYTITLELHPQVIDLTGWTDYSYDIVLGEFSTKNNGGSKVTLKMPELSRRDIQTVVKVYDGETVVLGGMVTDKKSKVDDKWPVLGEIPLIGRLFGNQSESSVKANLLISVTTRLMNGDGVPVRSNTANGLPDFHR